MSYTRKQALDYIEQSEYLRERCRREVRQLLDEADAQELLEDPDRATSDIYDALVAILLGIIVPEAISSAQAHLAELGLPPITNEEASSIAEDAVGSLEDTEQDAANALRDSDQRLRADGQAEATILAVLAAPASREGVLSDFLGLVSGAAAGVVALVEQGIQDLAQGKADSAAPNTLLRWYAVGDGRSCDGDVLNSCAPRDGMEKTLEDWRAVGLPGAGNLICSIYSRSGLPQCRCELGSANVQRLEPGMLDATEAIKAGRERANA